MNMTPSDLYREMNVSFQRAVELEAKLADAGILGHMALEQMLAVQLSRAYQRAQLFATLYLVQRSISDRVQRGTGI